MFPQLSDLPKKGASQAVFGAVYGLVFNTDIKLAVCAFAASAIADHLLFAIANPLFGGDLSVRSLNVYTATHTAVAILTILAFRRFQLIARTGTAVFAGLEILTLANRISQISQLENPEEG